MLPVHHAASGNHIRVLTELRTHWCDPAKVSVTSWMGSRIKDVFCRTATLLCTSLRKEAGERRRCLLHERTANLFPRRTRFAAECFLSLTILWLPAWPDPVASGVLQRSPCCGAGALRARRRPQRTRHGALLTNSRNEVCSGAILDAGRFHATAPRCREWPAAGGEVARGDQRGRFHSHACECTLAFRLRCV